MNYIGLVGKKQSGKDTTFALLHNALKPRPCVKNAFAGALKNEVARVTGHYVEYIDEHKENFRLILQGWGTDYRRKLFGEDYWIKKWSAGCETILHYDASALIVATDVRFANEVEEIKSRDGLLIRLKRDPEIGDIDNHVSETEQDLTICDLTLDNNGSLHELSEQVNELIRKYKLQN